MTIDVSTVLGGVSLSLCAMNAAGAGSSTPEDMRALAGSDAGAVVMKSTTVHPVTDREPHLRSLMNPGYQAYLSLVGELRASGTPVIASLAGFAVEEYTDMAVAYATAGADIIELNLADPFVVCNTAGHCDIEVVQAILSKVRNAQITTPLAVKLPAFTEQEQLSAMVRLLRQMAIPIVVCVNAPIGAAAAPTLVTHVQFVCEAGRGAFDVVAVGGVSNGQDILRALTQGAAAVQIGSAVQHEGPGLFTRLRTEVADLVQKAGYDSMQALRSSATR